MGTDEEGANIAVNWWWNLNKYWFIQGNIHPDHSISQNMGTDKCFMPFNEYLHELKLTDKIYILVLRNSLKKTKSFL